MEKITYKELTEVEKQIKDFEQQKEVLQKIQNTMFRKWIKIFSLRATLRELAESNLSYEQKIFKAKQKINKIMED